MKHALILSEEQAAAVREWQVASGDNPGVHPHDAVENEVEAHDAMVTAVAAAKIVPISKEWDKGMEWIVAKIAEQAVSTEACWAVLIRRGDNRGGNIAAALERHITEQEEEIQRLRSENMGHVSYIKSCEKEARMSLESIDAMPTEADACLIRVAMAEFGLRFLLEERKVRKQAAELDRLRQELLCLKEVYANWERTKQGHEAQPEQAIPELQRTAMRLMNERDDALVEIERLSPPGKLVLLVDDDDPSLPNEGRLYVPFVCETYEGVAFRTVRREGTS